MSAAVYWFSGAGHALAVARHIASELGAETVGITKDTAANADTAVVVFPVYCQCVPPQVKSFLRGLKARRIAAAAVYGGISHGDALREAQRLAGGRLTAAAYVPSGHTYLSQPPGFDREALAPFIGKLKDADNDTAAEIPRAKKDALAYLFPGTRSRLGVKIEKRAESCTGCGICENQCPAGTMRSGTPGRDCLRCLRCVSVCPTGALYFSCRPVLVHYLERKWRHCEAEIFI